MIKRWAFTYTEPPFNFEGITLSDIPVGILMGFTWKNKPNRSSLNYYTDSAYYYYLEEVWV
jgi:hypothetical protein